MPFGAVGGAVLGAAAIGAGASIYGASKQSKAVSKGADQAAAAQYAAIDEQRAAREQMRGDLAPYSQAGLGGLGALQNALGLNGQEGYDQAVGAFRAGPGYQFAVDEGMRATRAAHSAQGLNNSGAVLKALQARGQGLADQEFGTYYNRLAGLTSMGQNAAAMVGNAGMQSAGQIGNQLAGIAQTRASEGGALAGIQGNMYQGIGNSLMSGLNNAYYMYQANNQQQPQQQQTALRQPSYETLRYSVPVY